MEIGEKLRNLRIQKNLTQEELGERTDLTKGYISQLERDLSSPSMETFFNILEVLGITPEVFFSEKANDKKIVFREEDSTYHQDQSLGYQLKWLIPESNENEMEPILLTLSQHGAYKNFGPSLSETFVFVLAGSVSLHLGDATFVANTGESFYYHATQAHQLRNHSKRKSQVLLVATDSYL